MKRYRISLYTIFINLEDAEGRYLLIHGYTGAIDQASAKVISFLRSGKPIMESEELPFSKETLQRLIARGYVTDKSPFEEKDSVKSMAEAFHKRDKMRKNFLFLWHMIVTSDVLIALKMLFQVMEKDGQRKYLLKVLPIKHTKQCWN